MHVISRKHITDFFRKHADAKKSLEAWYAEAKATEWNTPQDIKDRYPSADFFADNKVVFNIKGNSYRLLAKIAYNMHCVYILKIGTHADYSKWDIEDL